VLCPVFATVIVYVRKPPRFTEAALPTFVIPTFAGVNVDVIVGVLVVVTVALGTAVPVAVLVNTSVFVGIIVFVGISVPVLVGIPVAVDVLVVVGVAVGGVPVSVRVGVNVCADVPTPLANPGNPHNMFEAPMMAPAAFTGSTTAQIRLPVPGNSAVVPGVTITPSVPTPHAM
jgi:hypothetical protein